MSLQAVVKSLLPSRLGPAGWVLLLPWLIPPVAARPVVIHVWVALCDNASQSIQPVPARIGNGDDPETNLYWGCDEGLKSCFSKSETWKRIVITRPDERRILERIVFRHRRHDAWLVADAWRGREIQPALTGFLRAAAGLAGPEASTLAVTDQDGTHTLPIAEAADLVVYIGHNGWMDFSSPELPADGRNGRPAIVLCCRSRQWFEPVLREAGARPLLMTTQLMYPGAFILRDVLTGWLAGEGSEALADRAAAAYAAHQSISLRAARGVFAAGAP